MTRDTTRAEGDREQRIRERAYHLWVAEGYPADRSDEFWTRAETEVGAESVVSAPDRAGSPGPVNAKGPAGKSPAAKSPAAKSSPATSVSSGRVDTKKPMPAKARGRSGEGAPRS